MSPRHTTEGQDDDIPAVGEIVDTVYGRQQVVDVLAPSSDELVMLLRSEHGGREWSVAVAQLDRVLLERARR